MICGAVFLIILFLFTPVPFYQYWTNRGNEATFPFHEVRTQVKVNEITEGPVTKIWFVVIEKKI